MGDKVLLPEYGGTKIIFEEKVQRTVNHWVKTVLSCSISPTCPEC